MSAASLHHHICLICGCNTNQIINIYEPRSGPNIVELIQAKFKFQPLNEDKYLCFSCNNWLINWHSLQANNSNDAESPSGTFRSSQVNGGMAQEKPAASQQQQHKQQAPAPPQQYEQQQQHHHRQKQIHSTTALCRPIAQVRPRQLIESVDPQSKSEAIISVSTTSAPKYHVEYPVAPKKRTQPNYAKRSLKGTYRHRFSSKKHLSHCCLCGRSIVFYIRSASGTLRQLSKPKRTAKCRKCRSVCQWRSIYMRSLTKERTKPLLKTKTTIAPQNLVSQVDNASDCPATKFSAPGNQSQYLNRPLVDGKIVSMLRRLGTTLSREHAVSNNAPQPLLPPIMSPTKPRPRWTRRLEADEILLHFETAISEVLPIGESAKESTKQTPTRRKLTYQMSCGSECETQENTQKCMKSAYQDILSSLPKGLDISLI